MLKKRFSKKKLKKVALCSILLIILCFCIRKYWEITVYDSLNVDISDKVFEYGNQTNLKNFLSTGNKKFKYSILKDLDTSKYGKQQVLVKVEYKSVAKVVPFDLDVVDTIAPNLEIKEESITIDEGTEISLLDNIGSVNDNNTDIQYKVESEVTDELKNYYTIKENGFNCNAPGEYTIDVVAVDSVGNKTEKNFKVVVNEVVKVVEPEVVYTPASNSNNYYNDVASNAASNEQGGDIVSIAWSYVGYPYVYGGNSPETGFDCSGFVQYVYSRVGKYVSRSSSTQAYDGVGVNYSEAEPGDILSWGHGGMVTHSAIYIGNGQMIHAMNSNSGVIVSPVNGWTNYDVLMAVRRVA